MSSYTSSSESARSAAPATGEAADRLPVPAWARWRLFGLGVAILLLAVVLLEGVCRVVSPVYLVNPNLAEVQVSGPGYRKLRPLLPVTSNVGGREVTFPINSDGFRDREVPADRGCLILGVGNSFVANWALHPDEFWSTALERQLASRKNRPACAVRSVGVQGWTLQEIYAALLDKSDAWRPDAVVLVFNGATMWSEKPIDIEGLAKLRAQWDPKSPPAAAEPEPTSLLNRLIGLYNRLESQMALLGTVKRIAPMMGITVGLSQLVIPASFETARLERSVGPTLRAIEQLNTLLRERGTRLVVVRVPELAEVDDDVYYVALAQRGSTSRGLDRHAAGKALAEGMRAAGIPYADLLERFRSASEPTFNLIDQHWSAHGNRIGAEVVQDLLEGLPLPAGATPVQR